MLEYNKIKEEILNFEANTEILDFDYQIEDKSFKLSITRNDCIENDTDLFGVDVNIFNNTLDYSIINYGGEMVEHKYYEKFDLKFLLGFLKKTINSLEDNELE